MARDTTKADLAAANRETRQLMDQIVALKKERDQAEAVAEHEQDLAVVAGFVRLVRTLHLPSNVCLCAAVHDPQRQTVTMAQILVADLERAATAIDRLGLNR